MSGGSNPDPTKPTADQNVQQQVNANLWNYYKQNYQPYINKYAANETSNEAAKAAAVQGQANASIMENLPQVNANPAAAAKQTAIATQTGTGAETAAQGAARARFLSGEQNVIDIGRGQQTQAVSGLNELAGQSLNHQITVNNIGQEQSANDLNTAGSAVGAISAMASRPQAKTLSGL